MTTITERVAAGAAFLDEHDPDWWKAGVERAIDLDGLSLVEPDMCVLGQRCPLEMIAARCHVPVAELDGDDFDAAYHVYVRHLADIARRGDVIDWSEAHGFTTGDGDWDDLTAEWKRVITERRSA
jgi:hypothetical protein